MLSSGRSSSMYPFTPTQWQELEHQALIYKYMASGIPIPPDLLLPIRSSYFLSTTPTLLPHLPQPTMGWSCYQMGGYGRKAEDPEPGRCRRTDGKKWRCSKEAYTDSKYCERHMHRGKNRSRKPVEISLNNNNNNSNRTATAAAYSAPSFSLPLSAHESSSYPHHPYYTHHATSEQRENNNKKLCYGGGGSAWELMPLGLGEPKPKQHDYYNGEEEEEKKQHCFVLGADFKLGSSKEEEEQRPLRRFFDDEWPQKSRRGDPWMLAPKTQLSISVPMGGLHPSHLINGSCERGL